MKNQVHFLKLLLKPQQRPLSAQTLSNKLLKIKEPAKKKQCMTSPCASNAASIARSPSIEHLTEYESHQKLEFTFSKCLMTIKFFINVFMLKF